MRKIQWNRKQSYSQRGFLSPELSVLKTIPLNVPYMQTLIRERLKLFRQAGKEGWTKTQYERAIAMQYIARGWRQRGEPYSASNIYAMVKYYEAEWRINADPNDPYLLKQKRRHHGHFEALNRPKVLSDKRKYNARPDVKAKRAKYRLEHRPQILEAERQRRAFLRNKGTAQ
jgi:hypothetical protein